MASADEITCEQCLSKLKGDKYEYETALASTIRFEEETKRLTSDLSEMFARLAEFARFNPFFGCCNLKSMRIAQIAVKFFMISTTSMPKRCDVRILKRKLCSKRWRGGLQSEMAVFGSLLDTEMERGRESRSRVRKK